ncbi:MAG TPA: hypothetical protein VK948_09145 [Aeromicrobium sp.]|nr:hypothetical protein [Aeromicrobium sp.]
MPLPTGARLVHVGLPKTGSTSLQTAFNALRPTLRDHGVVYPETGKALNHHKGASWLIGAPLTYRADPTPREAEWEPMREEFRRAGDRRGVLSYEMLCIAEPAGIERVREELGPQTHAVIVMRTFGEFVASYWQESIKRGIDASLDDWVRDALEAPDAPGSSGSFTCPQVIDTIERWTSVLGPENVTVIVLDSGSVLFDAVESMLALPPGILATGLSGRPANRGMTVPEAALIRQLNETLLRDWQMPAAEHRRLVLRGIVARLLRDREPAPGEPKLLLPRWAVDPAQAAGARIARAVRESGAQVLGDLAELEREPAASDVDASALPATLPVDLVVESFLGLMEKA